MNLDPPAIALSHQLTNAMPQLKSIVHADCVCIYLNQRWPDYTGAPRRWLLPLDVGAGCATCAERRDSKRRPKREKDAMADDLNRHRQIQAGIHAV